MNKKYKLSYGSRSTFSEEYLKSKNPDWEYPRWYFNYVHGIGGKRIELSVEEILNSLKDGTWHDIDHPWKKGTLEACINIGLIEKKIQEESIEYKITESGKISLENRRLPD